MYTIHWDAPDLIAGERSEQDPNQLELPIPFVESRDMENEHDLDGDLVSLLSDERMYRATAASGAERYHVPGDGDSNESTGRFGRDAERRHLGRGSLHDGALIRGQIIAVIWCVLALGVLIGPELSTPLGCRGPIGNLIHEWLIDGGRP